MKDSYAGGFLAHCAMSGVPAETAGAMLKSADGVFMQEDGSGSPGYDEMKRRRKRAKILIGMLSGGLMGGSMAHFGNSMQNIAAASGVRGVRKVKLKEAIMRILVSSAAGAATGGVAAHADNKFKDYLGVDPLATGVMTLDRK